MTFENVAIIVEQYLGSYRAKGTGMSAFEAETGQGCCCGWSKIEQAAASCVRTKSLRLLGRGSAMVTDRLLVLKILQPDVLVTTDGDTR